MELLINNKISLWQVLRCINEAIAEFKATRMPNHWMRRKNWETTEKTVEEVVCIFISIYQFIFNIIYFIHFLYCFQYC